MSTTLCLLTFNELEGCRVDIPKIVPGQFEDIYAIDGGSKDGTLEYLKQQGIKVHLQKRRSLNSAHWEAVEACQTEFIIFFHPKGTTSYSDALKLKAAMEQDGYDLAIASRNIAGGRNEEDAYFLKPRKWFVTALALLSAAIWRREGNMVWDVLHGFRGVRKSSFLQINPPQEGSTIDIATVIKSYRLRLKRIEIPAIETQRVGGTTHFKALPTGYKILVYMAKELLQKA